METTKTGVKSRKARRPAAREARLPSSASPDRPLTAAALAKEAAGAIGTVSRAVRPAGPVLAADGPSTNFSSELNNIDFKTMIGGPLQACVDAQIASSMATIKFIKEVGFQENSSGGRELVMVDFSHTRHDVNPDGTPKETDVSIKVPFLAILVVPSLRIEHVTIDFNVKLNSVETASTSTSLGINAEASGGFGPVNFKVSASYQRKATTGIEVKKEYALNVNVKAVQDEIPAGLEKILNMLAA